MANYKPGVVEGLRPPRRTAPSFEAPVELVGINPVVDLPSEVSAWFDRSGYLPVLGLLDGTGIRATLCPLKGGRHRLHLNAEMRDVAGVGVGDVVSLRLWPDEADRQVEVPADLERALRAADALDTFLSWSPSHRREYVNYVESTRSESARRSSVERAVQATLGKEGDRPAALRTRPDPRRPR